MKYYLLLTNSLETGFSLAEDPYRRGILLILKIVDKLH
jgi:hypothetical protein